MVIIYLRKKEGTAYSKKRARKKKEKNSKTRLGANPDLTNLN